MTYYHTYTISHSQITANQKMVSNKGLNGMASLTVFSVGAFFPQEVHAPSIGYLNCISSTSTHSYTNGDSTEKTGELVGTVKPQASSWCIKV